MRRKIYDNMGMITENIVAQMLVASGHKLFFYSNSSRDDAASRNTLCIIFTQKMVYNKC